MVVISISIILSACTSEVEKVCKVSDEENLQPFKDEMDKFLAQGNQTALALIVVSYQTRSAPHNSDVIPSFSSRKCSLPSVAIEKVGFCCIHLKEIKFLYTIFTVFFIFN